MTIYRERLWPSPALLVALLLLIPATLLVFLPVDTTAGVIVAVALYAGVAGTLLAMSPLVIVDEDGLRAGAAHLPASTVGKVSGFDGPDATAERGIRLDARAWLVIRGGVSPVVRIVVADDTDPTPYWLVSTRRPERFAAAIEELRQRTPGR